MFGNTEITLTYYVNKGMSLRDYFAAKAMQGTLSNEDRITQVIIEDYIAEACYKMADAMLKARQ